MTAPFAPDVSSQLRALVHAALYDTSTYEDDGAFTTQQSAASSRAAAGVRSRLAWSSLGAAEARFLNDALRAPDVDPARVATLLRECASVLGNDEAWRALEGALFRDPDPRIRRLALRARSELASVALKDPDADVRLDALRIIGTTLALPSSHAMVRNALLDPAAQVRLCAVAFAVVLDDCLAQCERLSSDPDEDVRRQALLIAQRRKAFEDERNAKRSPR